MTFPVKCLLQAANLLYVRAACRRQTLREHKGRVILTNHATVPNTVQLSPKSLVETRTFRVSTSQNT
ncbi:hypothetical protein [Nostoc sp.]|uniref:hypothetical protein n=1 Tax=Nostoc sp. TaxID=1180 RepID=UPI002FF9FFE3